jgi:hypothetical protein
MSVIRNHGLPAYKSEVLEANAMGRFPDCKYARVVNGLAFPFELVEVVQLWRSINDADVYPPLHEISYAIESRPAEAGGGKTP